MLYPSIPTIVVLVSSLFCSRAFAIKQLVHVSPNAATFRVERQDDGRVRFTVIRDSEGAQEPRTQSSRPLRSAQLSVSDGERVLLTAPIAPRVNPEGKLVYVFHVLDEYAPYSVLTISENLSGYLGDGTIHRYSESGCPEALRKLFDKPEDRAEVKSDR